MAFSIGLTMKNEYNKYFPLALIIGSGVLVWFGTENADDSAPKIGSSSKNDDDEEGAQIFDFMAQRQKRGLGLEALTWQEAQEYLRNNPKGAYDLVVATANQGRNIDIVGDKMTIPELINVMKSSIRTKRHVMKNFSKTFVRGLETYQKNNM